MIKLTTFTKRPHEEKIICFSNFQEMYNLMENDSTENVESEFDEDFSTSNHEILSIVLRSQKRVCGISIFRKDRTIEYFWDTLPTCCYKDATRNSNRIHQFDKFAKFTKFAILFK